MKVILIAIALILNVCASDAKNIDIYENSGYSPIKNPKECPQGCGDIIQTGAAVFKNLTRTVLKVYVIPDWGPFSKCTVYGVSNFSDVTGFNCKTDGNLYDTQYDVVWFNITVICNVNLQNNPAKIAAALNQKNEPTAPCGDKIPFSDTNKYAEVTCDAGTEDGVSTVKMTAYLGKVASHPTMRADKTLHSVYPLHVPFEVESPKRAFAFSGVPKGYENSVKCLESNRPAVQRRLLTSFSDTMYDCTDGKDQTIPPVQTLAYHVLTCISPSAGK